MTIDELKLEISATKMESAFYAERARSFQIKNGASDDYNLFLSEKYTKYADALEELKWYREQDLVMREDVSRKMYWLDVEELVQQIAKAKPPCVNSNEIKRELNEKSSERNGDCETCKHYDDERYCRDCYSRNDEEPSCYEPYIPAGSEGE